MENKTNTSSENGLLTGKLVHLAIPVRWSPVGQEGRGPAEMACTYDIHPQGARLVSAREVSIGDLVMIERGRNKAICRGLGGRPSIGVARSIHGAVRRRQDAPTTNCARWKSSTSPSFLTDCSAAHLRKESAGWTPTGQTSTGGAVRDSTSKAGGGDRWRAARGRRGTADFEYGARISSTEILRHGTDFRLMLNMFDVSVALKAQVKYLVNNLGMGVEFQEIRRETGRCSATC